MTAEEKRERASVCLARVELANAAGKFPSELSGGMQKRVGIARAIAMNPRYLFCDEPNSGLDPQTSIVIDNLIGTRYSTRSDWVEQLCFITVNMSIGSDVLDAVECFGAMIPR